MINADAALHAGLGFCTKCQARCDPTRCQSAHRQPATTTGDFARCRLASGAAIRT